MGKFDYRGAFAKCGKFRKAGWVGWLVDPNVRIVRSKVIVNVILDRFDRSFRFFVKVNRSNK